MTKETNEKQLYQCRECGFHYFIQSKAKECQDWCRKHKSCNLEIVQEAVENLKRTTSPS